MTNYIASTPLTLVIGSNGKTGRRVAERLAALGRPVRPGSRTADIPFDWQDQGTWAPAIAGVDAVYITYHPDLAFPGAADIVGAFADLAVANGVRRLVLLSGRNEEGAQLAERKVQESGADVTVVRCAFFSQNFSETFVEPVRAGVLAMPGGESREAFLDVDDIADVVVAALTDDRHIGEVYELSGPRLMTMGEVAVELSKARGVDVQYVPLSEQEYAAELQNYGLPAEEAEPLAELMAYVMDGHNAYLADGVRRALGREPKDFADYARETAAAGVWNPEA